MAVQTPKNRWKALATPSALVAGGTAICVLFSLALNFGLLLVDGLTPFGRSVVTALSLPLMIGMPLIITTVALARRVRRYRSELNHATAYDNVTACFKPGIFSAVIDRRIGRPESASDNGVFMIVHADPLRGINSRYGFEWRDQAIAVIADKIRGCIRRSDIVGRISEDQFAVFLPGATEKDAREIGERIRSDVAKAYFAPGGETALLQVEIAGVIFKHALLFDEMCRIAQNQLSCVDDPDELKLASLDQPENGKLVH